MGYKLHNEIHRADLRPHIKGNMRAVLLAMAKYGNEDGTSVYPSLTRLEKDLAVCRKTIQNAIEKLKEIGLLVQVKKFDPKTRSPNVYSIDLVKLAALRADESMVTTYGKKQKEPMVKTEMTYGNFTMDYGKFYATTMVKFTTNQISYNNIIQSSPISSPLEGEEKNKKIDEGNQTAVFDDFKGAVKEIAPAVEEGSSSLPDTRLNAHTSPSGALRQLSAIYPKKPEDKAAAEALLKKILTYISLRMVLGKAELYVGEEKKNEGGRFIFALHKWLEGLLMEVSNEKPYAWQKCDELLADVNKRLANLDYTLPDVTIESMVKKGLRLEHLVTDEQITMLKGLMRRSDDFGPIILGRIETCLISALRQKEKRAAVARYSPVKRDESRRVA